MQVEVAAGLPERQVVISLMLHEGATAEQAIAAADLERRLPGLVVDLARIGVFGKRVRPGHVLSEGDRVEVYRPLKADPKEVRRQLAELERRGEKGA